MDLHKDLAIRKNGSKSRDERKHRTSGRMIRIVKDEKDIGPLYGILPSPLADSVSHASRVVL
jgi:hypothetical protein